MTSERTFVLIKPDGVTRGLVGAVITRLERDRLLLHALGMRRLTPADAMELYRGDRALPFWRELVGYVASGPVVGVAVSGPNAIAVVRAMIGVAQLSDAEPGSIRAALGFDQQANVVHASDSPEAARRELDWFFRSADASGPTGILAQADR